MQLFSARIKQLRQQELDEHFIAAKDGNFGLQGALASEDSIPGRLHQARRCFLCFSGDADVYSQWPFLLLLAPCTICNAFFLKTISIGTSESSSCICEKAQ